MIITLKKYFSPLLLLSLILIFAAATRFWRLSFPPEYYFDEVYHVVTAKLIAQNDPRAYEWWHPAPEPDTAIDWLHPPLAKLTQAISMNIFGMQSFGWRLSSAIFGVGVIALVYAVARKLHLSETVSLLAAFLASLDGLLLTMSRITMNDIHVTFFMLLTIWLYLHWKQQPTLRNALCTGIAAGAAVASKWSGVFIVLPIFFDQLIWLIGQKIQQKRFALSPTFTLLGSLLLCIPLIYLLSYGQMFLQGHDWSHFKELHRQIWWYQTNLDATHPYQSTPLQWMLNLRPVYTYTNNVGVNHIQNMYIQGNPLLFWTGVIAVLWTISTFIIWKLNWLQLLLEASRISNKKTLTQWQTKLRRLQETNQDISLLAFLLVAYASPWILWSFSPRIMFFYHYSPAIPLLVILTSYWLEKLWQFSSWGKYLTALIVVAIALTFILFFPNWTGLVVNKSWSSLYFALSSWQ